MFHEVRRAKKQHKCSYGTNCTIEPGDIYCDDIITPWDMIADDVDDEGRTISSPSEGWEHNRYHQKCCFDTLFY